MKKKKILAVLTATAACAAHTATAQFFTNDLSNAGSVGLDFVENISSHSNAVWTYVSDGSATDQNGDPNTYLTNGAVHTWVTADDDTARSYLATSVNNYGDYSWTAHVAIETPAGGKPYIFFGLGTGVPLESGSNEPRDGENVFLFFRTGQSNSKVSVKNDNNQTLVNTGLWRGDPGYDFWMHYNHVAKTIQFELDDWNSGRFSDIDITTSAIDVSTHLTGVDDMRIFFGANAKVTWGDFYVHEISSDTAPFAPENVYSVVSNMAVVLKWDAAAITEGYEVKRSSESGSGYVTIGTTTNLVYTDTTVETNETYYYVIAATNAIGASDYSDEVTGVGLPYDIISNHVSTYGAGSSLDNDNLFDNDTDTFYDTTSPSGGWVGLDFGTNNAQQIMVIEYVLRDWTLAIARGTGATFEGANNADFSDAVLLHTVPSTVSGNPAVNSATVSNTSSFRYVRLKAPSGYPLYAFAEMEFYTAEDLTANGTPTEWLDFYYDVSGANPSNFADYAEADVSDTDGDGLLAYQEYQLSGDPTDASSPTAVDNLYAWPEAALKNVVRWDASAIADGSGSGYIVYRSLDDSTYESVAMVTTNEYSDTDVTAGVTYYYKASATNASFGYESAQSGSEMATANQYDISGLMVNSSGASKDRWFYELFDKNLNTFMDDNAYGGYASLDYGVGQSFDYVAFRLRNDSFGYLGSYEIQVNGSPVTVSRSPAFVYGNTFEGSNDGANWTVLATITNMVPQMVDWNLIPITDGTAYRYVRYYPTGGEKNFAMADVEFLPAGEGFTDNGTLVLWLEGHGLSEADDEVDTDTDGHESWEEYVAGTDPTDPNSVLQVNSFSLTNGLVLTWQSVEGKSYSIVTNSSLSVGESGTMATGIAGQAGETSYTGTVSGASTLFYEIGVE